jgi:hypothetical protein
MLFSTENNFNAIKERKKNISRNPYRKPLRNQKMKTSEDHPHVLNVLLRFPHMSNCAIRKDVAPENVVHLWPRSRNLRSQEGRHNSRLFPPMIKQVNKNFIYDFEIRKH